MPAGPRLLGGHGGSEKPVKNCWRRSSRAAAPAHFKLHTSCRVHSYWRAWFGEIYVHHRDVRPARVKRVLIVRELSWPPEGDGTAGSSMIMTVEFYVAPAENGAHMVSIEKISSVFATRKSHREN